MPHLDFYRLPCFIRNAISLATAHQIIQHIPYNDHGRRLDHDEGVVTQMEAGGVLRCTSKGMQYNWQIDSIRTLIMVLSLPLA